MEKEYLVFDLHLYALHWILSDERENVSIRNFIEKLEDFSDDDKLGMIKIKKLAEDCLVNQHGFNSPIGSIGNSSIILFINTFYSNTINGFNHVVLKKIEKKNNDMFKVQNIIDYCGVFVDQSSADPNISLTRFIYYIGSRYRENDFVSYETILDLYEGSKEDDVRYDKSLNRMIESFYSDNTRESFKRYLLWHLVD